MMPILRSEVRHIACGAAYKKRKLNARETCGARTFLIEALQAETYIADACRADLFSQTWFCTQCGAELCGDCRGDLLSDRTKVNIPILQLPDCRVHTIARHRTGGKEDYVLKNNQTENDGLIRKTHSFRPPVSAWMSYNRSSRTCPWLNRSSRFNA